MKIIFILTHLIVFSFIGYFFEAILFNNYRPDTLNILFGFNLPLKFIYGIAALLLIVIDDQLSEYNLLIKTLIATLIITLYECLAGQISLYLNSYQTWNYSQTFYPLCNNYISIEISAYWFLLILIFFSLRKTTVHPFRWFSL